MSLQVECISIFIPIEKLKKWRGIEDVDTFLRDQRENSFDCCCDEQLYRYPGGMNQIDVQLSLDFLKEEGLTLTRKYKGVEYWQDVCVVGMGGPTLPCRWLEYDPEKHVVWYVGNKQTSNPELKQ